MIQTSLLPANSLPGGFRFAAVTAGLKPSGRPDFAVAVADHAVSAAAMFTGNKVKAAPIQVGARHLQRSGGSARGVAVNARHGKCATGEAGLRACETVCAAAARTFAAEE